MRMNSFHSRNYITKVVIWFMPGTKLAQTSTIRWGSEGVRHHFILNIAWWSVFIDLILSQFGLTL